MCDTCICLRQGACKNVFFISNASIFVCVGNTVETKVSTYYVVMGDIDILPYDYCHEQISQLSRLLSTQLLNKKTLNTS